MLPLREDESTLSGSVSPPSEVAAARRLAGIMYDGREAGTIARCDGTACDRVDGGLSGGTPPDSPSRLRRRAP